METSLNDVVNMLRLNTPERDTLVSLLSPYQGRVVHVARCCGKVFIGQSPELRCRTCGSKQHSYAVKPNFK